MGFGEAIIDLVRQEVVQHPIPVYEDWAYYQGTRWDCTDAARAIRGEMWD